MSRSIVITGRTTGDPEPARLTGCLCAFRPVGPDGDAEVGRIAGLQHGHVHRLQLNAAGLGRHAIERRVRIGWLSPTLPSVYATAGAKADPLGRLMSAALYLRGDGLIAVRASAQLWAILDSLQQLTPDEPIDVLLARRNADRPPGIRVHRTETLARQDIRWRHGIPVTSPARTLLDLAATTTELELEAALSAALRANLVRPSQLRDVIQRNPRAPGIATLRALLEQPGSSRDTRSVYERKLLNLLREAELPLPLTNVKVGSDLVDGLWPDLKLVYEFDSWRYHGGRGQFEADRLRDQRLTITGHRVIRITGRQIDQKSHALIARISSIITSLRGGLLSSS